MSGWSAALRIARRDALRARGRSALVLAMVALPVLGVVGVDVLARTYELSPEQQATRSMGAADVALSDSGARRVVQDSGPYGGWTAVDETPRATPVDLLAAAPPGSRGVPERRSSGRVGVPGRVTETELHELAYDDPVAAGIYVQRTGQAPDGPDEAVLTAALAERLGVGLGAQVDLPAGPVTVVGTVDSTDRSDLRAVVLDAGALGEAPGPSTLLVDLPGPLTWDVVEAANDRGVVVRLRTPDVPGAPASLVDDAGDGGTMTAVGLVVGMALLEVVLLAGPAFAVGAKRQERVLALLAATGADRRDLRRTVLAGGVVLGLAAGLLGAVGGVALAAAALPVLPRWNAAVPGPFEVRALEVGAIAALGAATAVAAALLPALLAARQEPLAALTGRRGVRRTSATVPVAGLAVAAAGTALALQGARARSVNTVLAGAALAELGLVATTPAVVGLAGRLGPLLPAAPRLALRDAARNRARTAPAVAAVLAAVAGSVAVSTYVSSLDREDARRYEPQAASGALTASVWTGDPAVVGAVARAVEQGLPGTAPVVVRSVPDPGATADPAWVELTPAPGAGCPDGPACRGSSGGGRFPGQYVVGGPDVAHVVTGAPHGAAGVLDRGGVLVPAGSVRPDGTAVLVVHPPGDLDGTRGREVAVPAAALPADARQEPVLSERAARALGLPVGVVGVAALPAVVPDAADEDRVRAAVLAVDPAASVDVERGYESTYGVGLLLLLGGSALLVLGASGIATGLAAADGRADLSTLAAVGASPGLRRLLAGSQSVVTAGLGTVLGTVAGLVPAVGLIRAINAPDSTGYVRPEPFPLVVPWPSIAVTLLVVPLLAGLLAAALTRSRLPLVRRVA